MKKENQNKENVVKSERKKLKVYYQITFWIISVLFVLFAFVALVAGEYVGGCITFLGAICINPLFHKMSMKNEKVFNHLRRSVSLILIIIGVIIAIKVDGNFYIKNNVLNNSHEDIINVLNARLLEDDKRVDDFIDVEINDVGKDNNYKIYETRMDNQLSIQLVEKNDKIEAIRTCAVFEEGYEKSENDAPYTAGLIMGIIMNECGIDSKEGGLIAEELEKNGYNTELKREKFTLIMRTSDFYIETVIVYNTYETELIKKINTIEIEEKINKVEENLNVKEIDIKLETMKKEVENDLTSIYNLKYAKQTLEKYKKEIEKITLTLEENQSKKEEWQNIMNECMTKIDLKINILVPDFSAMTSTEAEKWGKENNITVTTSTEYSDTILNKNIISQSIDVGEVVLKGEGTIKIIYSLGKRPTIGEQNALEKAKIYANSMNMSKSKLYGQLTSSYGEGFTASEAQYAVEHVQADWNYNALQKAKSYQSTMNMSKDRIYQQLISSYGEGFTVSEAQYAIDNLGN